MIKTLDSSRELFALHSFEEKLGNVFTAFLIFCRNEGLGLFFLVLIVHGAETIVRIHMLVLGLGVFSLNLPDTLLLKRQSAPAVTYRKERGDQGWLEQIRRIVDMLGNLTYDFRKRTMVGFDRSRNVLLTDKIRTEKHERIGGTRNITL